MSYSATALKRDFSSAAASYENHATLQNSYASRVASQLLHLLPSNACILDAGCGTGSLADHLKANPTDYTIVGVDIAAAMCAEAQAHCLPVNANITTLPFASSTFDAVVCSFVLQWINDIPAALRELTRVLKTGGVLIISSFDSGTLKELRTCFAQLDNYPHVNVFTEADSLKDMAVRYGLSHMDRNMSRHTQYYDSLRELVMQLRGMGATNKHVTRRRSLLTPSYWNRLENCYRKQFSAGGKLVATWDVLTLALRKS